MTFEQANRKAYIEADNWYEIFNITIQPSLCDACKHGGMCFARLRYSYPIIKCNFFVEASNGTDS